MKELETQVLTVRTLAGPKYIKAPGGWKFDKCSCIVWHTLLQLSMKTKFKTRKEAASNADRVTVLANVLADNFGMSTFYWAQAAEEFVKYEQPDK